MLRIEAGLLLLEADFDSSRFAWNDPTAPRRSSSAGAGCAAISSATTGPSSAGDALEQEPRRGPRAGPCAAWSSTSRTATVSTTRRACPAKGPRAGRARSGWSTTTSAPAAGRLRRRASCTRRCSSATSPSPGCARTSRSPAPGSGSSSPWTTSTYRWPRSGPAAAVQPGTKDGPEMMATKNETRQDHEETCRAGRVARRPRPRTRSSSAGATTDSSTAPIWRGPACGRWSWSGATSSVAPPSPRSCVPASGSPRSRTRCRCSGRRSSRSWSSRGTASCRCR